jgi:outer membrane lipoprotein-sorting protein
MTGRSDFLGCLSVLTQRLLACVCSYVLSPFLTPDLGPRIITVFCFGMLAFATSGCTPRQPLSPLVPAAPRETSAGLDGPTAAQLLAPLRSRQQQLTNLRGLARVTYKDSEEKGGARQAVAVRAPDHIRVELFSPIGIAALVTTDGQRLSAYFPKEKTIYRGVASAENAARFLRIMLSASDIVNLLLGLPFSIPQEESANVRFDADRNWYVLSVSEEGGNSQTLVFDAQKRHLLRWEALNSDGTVSARMALADYRVLQGQEFPFEIVLTDFQGGQEAGIYYERVEINPPLANTLFTLAPIPGVQEVDLDTSAP